MTSTVDPVQAQRPFVVALDVGTSSTRAVLYDALGRAVEGVESRTAYQMRATPDGGVEMDPDELFELTCRNLDELLDRAGSLARGIRGVGCCTFWHSLLGVDGEGRPVTPIYNWSDTRSAPDASALAQQFGAEWVHSRTGAVPHTSYYPAKLLWLRRTDPERYGRVRRWMSPGEYFYLRIFGRALCSVSMASGTGLFNPNTCTWDEEVLKVLGLEPDRLSPLVEGDGLLTGMAAESARRWPALHEVPWLPAVGDGAASNIGSGCVTQELVALNVGTSGAMRVCWPAERVRIPRGLWCYRASRRYLLLGGALSNGGDVYAWCQRTLRLGSDEEVERQLARMEADGHGLTALPFFSGERSTGWAGHARAAVVGMGLSTRPVDILRAGLEAVAYRFAAIYQQLREAGLGGSRVVASGGGILNSPVWTRIVADAIGLPVVASAVPEASSRGAALLVLEALGQIPDLGAAPAPCGEVYQPDPANHERYRRARERQQRLYDRLIAPGPEVT